MRLRTLAPDNGTEECAAALARIGSSGAVSWPRSALLQ